MFSEISKIKSFSSIVFKNNAVEHQNSSLLIKFSCFFQTLSTFLLSAFFSVYLRETLAAQQIFIERDLTQNMKKTKSWKMNTY